MRQAGADRVGFGLAAITRLDGVESANTDDFELYCASSADFAAITADVRPL